MPGMGGVAQSVEGFEAHIIYPQIVDLSAPIKHFMLTRPSRPAQPHFDFWSGRWM